MQSTPPLSHFVNTIIQISNIIYIAVYDKHQDKLLFTSFCSNIQVKVSVPLQRTRLRNMSYH